MAALDRLRSAVPAQEARSKQQQESTADNIVTNQTGRAPRLATPEICREQEAVHQSASHQEEEVEITFEDFIDIINPLQRIPLFSKLYRQITGDEISAHARIVGGFAYGSLLGGLTSVFSVITKEISGRDIGEHIMAAFKGKKTQNITPDFGLALANDSPRNLEQQPAEDLVAFQPQATSKTMSPQAAASEMAPERDASPRPVANLRYEGQEALAILYRDLKG